MTEQEMEKYQASADLTAKPYYGRDDDRLTPVKVGEVQEQIALIQELMKSVMHKDEHYGVIPGTGTKPTLLKAGAEKLCLTFRLDPQYEITEKTEGVHLTVLSKCTLYHIPSGQRFGSGMGSCSTKESKYAYRKAARNCPYCHAEAIIRGKNEYGGGWLCFKKKGGCGQLFSDDDAVITGQTEGRVPNEDVADQYNTVLKMANKRSLVAAVLNATAASDIFTQDIEDMPAFEASIVPNEKPAPQAPSSSSPAVPPAEAGPKISTDQAMELAEKLAANAPDAEKIFCKVAKIERLTDLPATDYDEALAWISRRKRKSA